MWPYRIFHVLSFLVFSFVASSVNAQTAVDAEAAKTVLMNVEGMRGPDKGGMASFNYYFKGLWNEIGVGTTEFAFVVQKFDSGTGAIEAMLVPTSTQGMNVAALGINPRQSGLLVGRLDPQTLDLTLSYFQASRNDNKTLDLVGSAQTFEILLTADVTEGGLVTGWSSGGYVNVSDRNIALITLEALKRLP
jgi:hypothetical protein